MSKPSDTHPVVSRPLQRRFLEIPKAPVCYWLRERLFDLLAGRTLGDVAEVRQGLATAADGRFVRFVWEAAPTVWLLPARERRWVPYEKGGGYGKWFGHHFWTVDWGHDGARIRATPSPRVQNEQYYFREGWTYSYMARGCLGLRRLGPGSVFSHLASAVFSHSDGAGDAMALNCRLASMLVRSLSAKIQLNESYVARLPAPPMELRSGSQGESFCVRAKACLVSHDLLERTFDPCTLDPLTVLASSAPERCP